MRKLTEEFICDICGEKQIINSTSEFDSPIETFSIVITRKLFNQEYIKVEDICESCCDRFVNLMSP